MEEKRKKFGMEMLPSLRLGLKQKALQREVPLWKVTEEAISLYLDAGRGERAPYPGHEDAHEELERILTKGEEWRRTAILGNLRSFVEAIDANEGSPQRKRRGA